MPAKQARLSGLAEADSFPNKQTRETGSGKTGVRAKFPSML
jgi:hypothetical protein